MRTTSPAAGVTAAGPGPGPGPGPPCRDSIADRSEIDSLHVETTTRRNVDEHGNVRPLQDDTGTELPGKTETTTTTTTTLPISHENSSSSASISESSQENNNQSNKKSKIQTHLLTPIYRTLTYIPPSCRWNPSSPPKFSLSLNILFAFAGAFTVANLYYSHPILNILATDFHVDYTRISQIPTLAQAGYAAGLLFLCPLGDILPRRPFVLTLVFATATLCIAMAVTKSVVVFSTIQFLTAVTTVTPQLMMPLVGDLAPPGQRAFALSIVSTGLSLGILLARLLAGIVTQYTSWRNIYWMSVGLQYLIFGSLWCCMPDYPSTNADLRYGEVLWSIVGMVGKYPVLVQACLVSFCTSATFTNFWTTLTFLLAGEPYHYSPVVIGLFALIGICAMLMGPVYAKYVTDRFVPLFTVLLGMCWCMIGITVGTYTGTFTVVGPILQALFNDFGSQSSQIANRSSIFTVEPKGRNRVNTAYMVFTFAGQLTGTSVGASLYERKGWVASGSFSVASIAVALLVTLSRGPWEEGWIGWHGGWSIWKKDRSSADGKVREEDPASLAQSSVNDEESTTGMERDGRGDDQGTVHAVDAEKSIEWSAANIDTADSIHEKRSSRSGHDDIDTMSKQ